MRGYLPPSYLWIWIGQRALSGPPDLVVDEETLSVQCRALPCSAQWRSGAWLLHNSESSSDSSAVEWRGARCLGHLSVPGLTLRCLSVGRVLPPRSGSGGIWSALAWAAAMCRCHSMPVDRWGSNPRVAQNLCFNFLLLCFQHD